MSRRGSRPWRALPGRAGPCARSPRAPGGQLLGRDPPPGLEHQQGGATRRSARTGAVCHPKWPSGGHFGGACCQQHLHPRPIAGCPAGNREMEYPHMPGLVPPVTRRRAALPVGVPGSAALGIRYAANGLTDAQAAARPRRQRASASAGWSSTPRWSNRTWVAFIVDGDSMVFLPEYDWADGFRLVDGETLADVVTFSADVARHDRDHRLRRCRTSARRSPRHHARGALDPRRSGPGRPAGCCSTSSRRRRATRATPTSSASRSTAPPAGRSWRRPKGGRSVPGVGRGIALPGPGLYPTCRLICGPTLRARGAPSASYRLGRRRCAQFVHGGDVSVVHHSFELDPCVSLAPPAETDERAVGHPSTA